MSRPTTYDHVRSHGSGFLRQGAVVFGLGSFSYHLLEFAAYFILDLHPHCLDVVHTVNSFLSIIFILLQTTIIILYPRQRTYTIGRIYHPSFHHPKIMFLCLSPHAHRLPFVTLSAPG